MKSLINYLDEVMASTHVKLKGDRPALSSFLFHACLNHSSDYDKHFLYPQERLTVQKLDEFIDYFLQAHYTFISPQDVLYTALDPEQHYALLTFDDGYFNNLNIIPVLEKYQVPAVFYVPTYYIDSDEIFWSDALYKKRKEQGQSDEKIIQEVIFLKSHPLSEINDYMVKNFDKYILYHKVDEHRFMTSDELKQLNASPYAHIGNHTHRHEILTHLSLQEVKNEILTSQKILQNIIGESPQIISYPNGSFSPEIIECAYQCGMKVGQSTIMKKNDIPVRPISEQQQLLIHRFNPVVQNGQFHFKKLQSSFQFKTILKKWLG